MKTEKNISLFETHKIALLLFLAIFAMQGCGPKPLNPGPTSTSLTNVEDMEPDNIFADLCFGNDSDGDGVCDDEEDIECINDPNCVDDPDVQIDGLNSDYKNGGAVGRWIGTIAAVAAGAGAAYGLVGASGLVSKKGEKKWGWLHNLIKDNPDRDGIGFLRILRADDKTLADDVVDLDFEAEEQFYTHPITGQPWVNIIRKLELKSGHRFGTSINGRNHGGPVVSANSDVKAAGRVILTCISGMKQFVDGSFNPNVTKSIAGENGATSPQDFSSARINVLMDKSYLSVKTDPAAEEWFKAKKTKVQFENHCRDTPTGGAWIALQLNDKLDADGNQLYFVNPMPTSIFSNAGFGAIQTTMQNYAGTSTNFGGFYIDYLLREGESTITDDASIDSETVITARRYSDQLNVTSGHYNIPLSPQNITDYNDIAESAAYNGIEQITRAKYLMGMFTGSEVLVTQDERTPAQIRMSQTVAKEETVTASSAEDAVGVETINELDQKTASVTVNNKSKTSPYAGATVIIHTEKVIFQGGQ